MFEKIVYAHTLKPTENTYKRDCIILRANWHEKMNIILASWE